MINLPDETVIAIFNLQWKLLQLIDEVTETGFVIFEQHGNITTTYDLELLQNARERATSYYVRLYQLLLQVTLSPSPNPAILSLLAQSMNDASAHADAIKATVKEAQRDWNFNSEN